MSKNKFDMYDCVIVTLKKNGKKEKGTITGIALNDANKVEYYVRLDSMPVPEPRVCCLEEDLSSLEEMLYKTTIVVYSTRSMRGKNFEDLHLAENDGVLLCEEQDETKVSISKVPEGVLSAFNLLDATNEPEKE